MPQATVSENVCFGAGRPQAFWHTFTATRQKTMGALTSQQWQDALQDLFDPKRPEAPQTQRAPESRPRTGEAGNGALKVSSTHTQTLLLRLVAAALDRLKRHKVAGIDGILPDFLKDGKSCQSV